jgi:light-regulated signal transduction histidine kinase (bacteriophytochrome)
LIHTPIQDIGLLFLVDYESFDLLQVSENIKEALGIDAAYPIIISDEFTNFSLKTHSTLLSEHKNLKTLLDLDESSIEALKEQGGPALCDISSFNAKYHIVKHV